MSRLSRDRVSRCDTAVSQRPRAADGCWIAGLDPSRDLLNDPGGDGDFGRHPLGAGAHEQRWIPGRVGQELLQRLVACRWLAEPKRRRLQALAAPVLEQAAHVEERVLALVDVGEPRHHLVDEGEEALARLRCRYLG